MCLRRFSGCAFDCSKQFIIMEVARFEPRQRITKFETCSVSGCNSKAKKDLTIRFHRFPTPGKHFVKINNKKVDRFLAWKSLLKIDRVNTKTKICSLHFLKNDYFFPDIEAKKRILKKTAVPSCNLPGDNGNRENNASSRSVAVETLVDRPKEEFVFVKVEAQTDTDMEEEHFVSHTETDATPEFFDFQTVDIKTETPIEPFFKDAAVQANSPIPSFKDAEVQVNPNSSSTSALKFPFEAFIRRKPLEPPTKDVETQVNTDCFVSNVIHSIKSDSDLFTATGIETFDVLNTIVQRVTEICGNKFEHLNIRLNTRDRVIMTYMKCKHNLSYNFLSVLFRQYTPTHCQRIFAEIVEILGKCSKEGIPWLSVSEIPTKMRKLYQAESDLKANRQTSAVKKRAITAPYEKGEKGKEEVLKKGRTVGSETNAK